MDVEALLHERLGSQQRGCGTDSPIERSLLTCRVLHNSLCSVLPATALDDLDRGVRRVLCLSQRKNQQALVIATAD
jgi:hypothetical protein